MKFAGRDLKTGVSGDDVRQLHADLDNLGYAIPRPEQQESSFADGTDAAVRQFQTARSLPSTGIVDAATAEALRIAILGSTYTVTGTVTSPVSLGVNGLTVDLVDKNVGGDVALASGITDTGGSYTIKTVITDASLRARRKTSPDLQVRVSAGSSLLAVSAVRYDAPLAITLDMALRADAPGLPSEHETLTARLAAAYDGKLASLVEPDIIYLANKTGWAAAVVAMAALAEQFSQTASAPAGSPSSATASSADAPATGASAPAGTSALTASLHPAFYYALFRSGAPANVDQLFRIPASRAAEIWTQAISQGVIPAALQNEIPPATQAFQTLAASQLLNAPPKIGISNLPVLLGSVLTGVSQQNEFASLLGQYGGDWNAFWTAAQAAFGEAAANQLKVLGQLNYLTLNNAPLVTRLVQAVPTASGSLQSLVSGGLYDPAKWTPLIGSTIPAGLPGTTPAAQAANYAAFLAAQVKLAFPTAVFADQISRRLIPLAAPSSVAAEVSSFLSANQAAFAVGAEPVEAFIARTNVAAPSTAALGQIKALQRVYAVTTKDEHIAVLLSHKLDSSYAITRYDEAGFIRAFGPQLGGAAAAGQIHRRARALFGATLILAVRYGVGLRGPAAGGRLNIIDHGSSVKPLDTSNPSLPAATLGDLFGSLDYCNCSDCNSLLSPAAYFVDLLHYLDQPSPTAGLNPQAVLFARRPDLEYLALSCENTNTALPYIDIVNETLEAFVAGNLSLAGFEGFNAAPDVISAELIAAPQNVNDNAYAALQASFYPAPLPFNRPLELLRQHMNALGVALPDAMIALRAGDAIINSATPTSYGWPDILIEQLGLSRDEFRLFTDASLQLGDLYGLPRASGQTDQQWNAATLATLQAAWSLKDFSTRTGVDYDDLLSVLTTKFINPGAALIERVEALGVSFAAIQALHGDPVGLATAFIAGLPAGLDYSQYGGTDGSAVVNWLTGPNYGVIMSLIIIANPTGSTDDCTGTALYFRYASPNPAANLLTATDFLKLIRFIRLWRKLQSLLQIGDDGAAIQATDALLNALYPPADLPVGSGNAANDPTNRPLLDSGFKVALQRVGFLLRALNRLSLASGSLTQLLACWNDIGTTGSQSLYASMFLTPTLLLQDPGAQAATVSPAVNTGDRLTTTIDTVPVVYTVAPADTPQTVASNMAAAINATTTTDPMSGQALNRRFHAQAKGTQVVIAAGFGIQWNVSVLGAGTLSAATVTDPTAQSATVGGAPAESEIFTVTIDTIPVSYVAKAGDTATTVATGLAAAINATTTPHPYSGLPLNGLLAASAVGAVVAVRTADAGPPFDLACSIALASTGTYTAGPPVPAEVVVMLAGTVTAANVVTLLLNNVALTYTVLTTDSSLTTLAASLANTINGAVQLDPTTGLPFSQLLHAACSGTTLTITSIDPSTSFTAAISSNGTEQFAVAGPSPASQTAVVTGTFPAGAVLTTTINGADLFETVVPGDTAAALATKIANAINAATLSDPTTGLPLDTLVSASASGGTITLTATSLTTAFTLAAAASQGAYTAGRLNPPFADNGYGAYLDDPAQTLFGHQPLLSAACNLTGAEFALITAALGFGATTPLSLANVSALFRYGWLAHSLGISVLEFLALRRFSGLDPFAPLDPSPTPPAKPPVIRFIQLVQAMQKAGLVPVQALYLIWNQDLSGTLAPEPDAVAALALALRADFIAVESQFTLPDDDPDGSIAKQLMTTVYGAADTDFFFGLLNQTFTVSVPCSYASPILPQPVLAAADGLLAYDDAAKTLSVSGLLSAAGEAAIAAAAQVSTTDSTDNLAAGSVTLTPVSMANIVPGAVLVLDSGAAQETIVVTSVTATSFAATTTKPHNGSATPFPIVNDPGLPTALTKLAAASQQAVAPFFARYPELLALYDAYAASTAPLQTRRTTLLASFLPTLINLRKVEQALAAITAQIGCDPSFAPVLLQHATILHADVDPTLPAVADLTGIETGGLTAELFLGNDPKQPPDQTIPAVGPVAYIQTATLAGTITAGTVITTTINGQAIVYTVTSADTGLDELAGQVAAAINAGTSLATAAASGATIDIEPSQPLTATSLFTLACTSSASGLTYTAGHQLPSGPGNSAIAGRWSGYITPPQTGNYDIRVVADPGAAVSLEIDGKNVPMALVSGVWSNQVQIALNVGELISIALNVGSVKTTLALGWSSPPNLGWTLIPATALFPAGPMARLGATYVRFLKAASLASALSLTANETAWLGTDTAKAVETQSTSVIAPGNNATFSPASMANITVGARLIVDTGPPQETVTVASTTATSFTAMAQNHHDGSSTAFPIISTPKPVLNKGWLNSLPGAADADPVNDPIPDLATAAELTIVLAGVLDFARLKQALSRSDERLLDGLQNPLANLPNGQNALLGLTGWAQVSVQTFCARFFGDASLSHLADVENFARVYDAMAFVQACRVTAPTLLAAVTNAPTPTTVSGLQSALRALYSPSDWLSVVKPVNDSMRQLQRDALVKWILQGLSAQPGNTATTADDLYALFLIDPSTEPAVVTSRIRLALSAVQLFIERILQGLEASVSSGDIDPQQWEWMKRYRVWEANREVFLWPENWLYPELRDDQSPIFQQVMSSLLQSDITDDAATEAYLDYLSGLHDVAKLEPCGMYYVPATADTNEITYVVARSFGAQRKYYFRQLQDAAWSPWTEVPIECEDMPLTPIMWNGRLFLFWLKVVKDSSSATQVVSQQARALTSVDSTSAAGLVSTAASASQQVPVQAILFWSEYYNGKWQPTKSSDPRRPTMIGSYNTSGPDAFEAFRSRTRLVPAKCTGAFAPRLGGPGPVILLPSIPDNALILAIETPQNPFPRQPKNSAGFSGGAGFLLHNTHSAPTPLEDVPTSLGNIGLWLDVPAPHRQIEAPGDPLQTTLPPYSGGPSAGNLTISYFSTSTEVEQDTPELSPLVLQFHWLPRIVESQPGLTGIWTAPFFYEDRRNLFYVTSTIDQTTFRGPSFGIGLGSTAGGSSSVNIPQLQIDRSTADRMTVTLQGLGVITYQGTDIQNASSAGAAALAARRIATIPSTPSVKGA